MSSTSTPSSSTTKGNIWDQIEEAKKGSYDPATSKWVKIKNGETLTLQFIQGAMSLQDATFNGKPTGGKVIVYTVIDPRYPSVPKTFSVNVRKADSINALLKAGKFLLAITKTGEGKDQKFTAVEVGY